MASLVAQTVGVLAAAGVIAALATRAEVRLPFPAAAAAVAVPLLAVLAVATYREAWHHFDVQRASYSHLSENATRTSCAGATHIDSGFVYWLAARIPVRERYFPTYTSSIARATGNYCFRLLLLPRIATRRSEGQGARYVVFWGVAPRYLVALVHRRGGTIETYKPGLMLGTLP